MYVQKGVTGWLVCEEDGDILKTFKSKSAATLWMRDMLRAVRLDLADEIAAEDALFLATHRD